MKQQKKNGKKETVMFVSTPYKAREDEVFVDAMVDIGDGTTDRVWERRKKSELKEGERPIPCIICGEPAVQLDHCYPNENHGNRCERHRRSLIDEELYDTLGVGLEVCKDHYMMLQMVSQMRYCRKWLGGKFGADMTQKARTLFRQIDMACSAAWQFMGEQWPDEQFGPSGEAESKAEAGK